MAAAAWETAALPSEFAAWSTALLLGGGLAFLAYVLWSSVAAAPATATLPPARSQQAEQRHSGSSGEEEPSSDEEELGIGPANQRLVFGGKTLGDAEKLRERGVQAGATLHLVLRLKT